LDEIVDISVNTSALPPRFDHIGSTRNPRGQPASMAWKLLTAPDHHDVSELPSPKRAEESVDNIVCTLMAQLPPTGGAKGVPPWLTAPST
jgi:hypothetical protein